MFMQHGYFPKIPIKMLLTSKG